MTFQGQAGAENSGFLFCFCFSFSAALRHMEFPGQGSDPSYSCNLRHSCGHAGSFNPLCWAGDRTCVLVLQRHRYLEFHGRNSQVSCFPRFCGMSACSGL